MVNLIVPGEPVAKARPRWAKWGMYTPKKTVNYETQIRERFSAEYPGFQPLESAIRIELSAFLGIPRSEGKRKQRLMEAGSLRPKKRPDIDNCEKAALDALQGIAFRNDSQICEIETKKWYSRMPRLEIRILEIKEQGDEE